jgi:hypothetical protein
LDRPYEPNTFVGFRISVSESNQNGLAPIRSRRVRFAVAGHTCILNEAARKYHISAHT